MKEKRLHGIFNVKGHADIISKTLDYDHGSGL